MGSTRSASRQLAQHHQRPAREDVQIPVREQCGSGALFLLVRAQRVLWGKIRNGKVDGVNNAEQLEGAIKAAVY
ncbi:hypothetical protein [Fluviispira sanaruensis]|uniref:Uncharacterized protein n=1 Tax=Fluviispira sanaruensis TaxID=2493639 RepID=A0A4P2VWB0_FLUSA|nr:hypothetical protein [Fluviispira sanaruensis]BBH53885.1 hypothetical protein JCM31447_23380 [Fluviispira sanaruensis]